jgi:EAL domain-containing protein (putative c-di-GMP-specific phosphodiesterase class I)
MTTVAEGVETPAQLERLTAMGCPAVQGFLLGGPMSALDIGELIRRPAGAAVPLLLHPS